MDQQARKWVSGFRSVGIPHLCGLANARPPFPPAFGSFHFLKPPLHSSPLQQYHPHLAALSTRSPALTSTLPFPTRPRGNILSGWSCHSTPGLPIALLLLVWPPSSSCSSSSLHPATPAHTSQHGQQHVCQTRPPKTLSRTKFIMSMSLRIQPRTFPSSSAVSLPQPRSSSLTL